MAEKRWMTMREVAEYMGFSRAAVHRWIKEGTIPCHKVGSRWRFDREEIDAWMRSGSRAGQQGGQQEQAEQ